MLSVSQLQILISVMVVVYWRNTDTHGEDFFSTEYRECIDISREIDEAMESDELERYYSQNRETTTIRFTSDS